MNAALAARLDELRSALSAEPSQAEGAAALAPWRDRIDALDRAVVALLNERASCAAAIGEIKRGIGAPVYAPRREEEVLANALSTNGGPLSPEAVRRIVERVIDETRNLERELSDENRGIGDASVP